MLLAMPCKGFIALSGPHFLSLVTRLYHLHILQGHSTITHPVRTIHHQITLTSMRFRLRSSKVGMIKLHSAALLADMQE